MAATATAITETLIVLIRGTMGSSTDGLLIGALISALFTLGALLGIGTIIAWGLGRIFSPHVVSQGLQMPMDMFFGVMRGADAKSAALLGRLLAGVATLIVLAAAAAGITLTALSHFHEPFRISILVGVTTVLTAIPLRYGLTTAIAWLSKRRFLRRSEQLAARIGVLVTLVVMVGGTVLLLVFRHAIFGARDPYPGVMIVLYVALLLSMAPISKRLSRVRLHRLPVSLLSASLLILGVVLSAASKDGRAQTDTNGAFSSLVFRAVYTVLDMDGDGVAWLIGSDCHPFDPNAGPFAKEIPNNGYDENCDGRDTLFEHEIYIDPLSRLAPFPKNRRIDRGNVLLIISDATAAKHLKLYGNRRNTMPNLERFAKKATIFENAFASANHTSIAMPAMLTGRFPSTFPLVQSINWNSFGIPKWTKPLQLRFPKAKYHTYMLAGHNLYGFIRHFKHVQNGKGKRLSAEELGKMTLEQLKKIGPAPKRPVFVVAHFIDPHHPYRAARSPYKFGKKAVDRYERELNYVDDALNPILKLMDTEPYKKWLVLVTSDHGESFLEHNSSTHGASLYDEEVRIPLIARVPHTSPSRISLAVSHLDIVPTLIDWCDLTKDRKLPGLSWLPLIAPATPLDEKLRRIVYAEFFRTGDVFGAFDGRYAMIYNKPQDRYELYDKRTDPQQKNNIYSEGQAPLIEGLLKDHIRASEKRLKAGIKRAEKEKKKH